MKSRVQNRTRIQTRQEQTQQFTQSQPVQEAQKVQQNIIPRPLYPSVNQIIKHTKFAINSNTYSFPPADTLFNSQNIHDAGPNFIRPTSGFLSNVAGRWNFPIGAWIMPFGHQNVAKITLKAPFRCQRCKAYANPYFLIEPTNVFCNICSHRFAPDKLDPIILNSAQLYTHGVIDFKVSDPIYFKKEVNKVKIIIAVQMNKNSIQTTIFQNILQSIRSCISSSEFEIATRFAIVIYNQATIFYKVRNISEDPIQYIVTDPIDSLCPLSQKDLFYDPNVQGDKQRLIYLLDWLLNKIQQYKIGSNITNYFSTVQCLSTAFGNNSGRIVLFSISDPINLPGKIRNRQKQQLKTPLKPLHDQYKQLGKSLAKKKIGLDHFIFGKQGMFYHELATTNWMSSLSGGSLYHYFIFNPQINGQHLYYSIYKNLTRQCAYDVDFTCRVSNGLTVSNYSFSGGIHQQRDIGLGVFDSSQSIFVKIQQQQKLAQTAYLQFAIMFTNQKGERIVRVINYRFYVTDKLEMIHAGADYLAFSNYIFRKFAHDLYKFQPIKVLDQCFTYLVSILAQYKQQKANLKYSELQVHPSLKNSLVYIYAFLSSINFTNLMRNLADLRIVEINKINTIGFQSFANRYYPKLYSIDLDIYNSDILPGDFIQETDIAIIPPNIPLTSSSLKADSAYLLNDSEYLYIFIMEKAPQDLLMQLFGVSTIEQIQGKQLPELQSGHNIRVINIVNELRRRNQALYLPMLVLTPRDGKLFTERLSAALRQDNNQRKYNGFLKQLHARIQSGK